MITDLLAKEHPDVSYLKQDGIALVLSRCLMQTYLQRPQDPIEYFAKSLLGQARTKRVHNFQIERETRVLELKEKNSYFIKTKLKEVIKMWAYS